MFQKDESVNQKRNRNGKEQAVRNPVMKTLATVCGRGNESHNLGRPDHESLILELGPSQRVWKRDYWEKTGRAGSFGEID